MSFDKEELKSLWWLIKWALFIKTAVFSFFITGSHKITPRIILKDD
jgi:hypothetical protein